MCCTLGSTRVRSTSAINTGIVESICMQPAHQVHEITMLLLARTDCYQKAGVRETLERMEQLHARMRDEVAVRREANTALVAELKGIEARVRADRGELLAAEEEAEAVARDLRDVRARLAAAKAQASQAREAEAEARAAAERAEAEQLRYKARAAEARSVAEATARAAVEEVQEMMGIAAEMRKERDLLAAFVAELRGQRDALLTEGAMAQMAVPCGTA